MKELIEDIRTYEIITHNENYKERLFEAYKSIKELGISSKEEFEMSNEVKIGAFGYSEIMIFDRIANDEYERMLSKAWNDIHNNTEEYKNNPTIGDQLASWGTLGKTPYRDNMIKQGLIIEGLTSEEKNEKFR